jgi:hypothetical protein
MWGTFWLSDDLLASQEGFRSTELVSSFFKVLENILWYKKWDLIPDDEHVDKLMGQELDLD